MGVVGVVSIVVRIDALRIVGARLRTLPPTARAIAQVTIEETIEELSTFVSRFVASGSEIETGNFVVRVGIRATIGRTRSGLGAIFSVYITT